MGCRAFVFAATIILCCLLPPLAMAQGLPAADSGNASAAEQLQAQPLSPEAVRELVARLDDAEVRQILIQRLDAGIRPGEAGSAELDALLLEWRDEAEEVRNSFSAMLQLSETSLLVEFTDLSIRYCRACCVGTRRFVALAEYCVLRFTHWQRHRHAAWLLSKYIRLAMRPSQLRIDGERR